MIQKLAAGIFVLGMLLCACSRPSHIRTGGDMETLAQSVVEVRMHDTIATQYVLALDLDNVVGTGFRSPSGELHSYFNYEGDPRSVLRALASLPFSLRDAAADVGYRYITEDEFITRRKAITSYEVAEAASFWYADLDNYLIIESIKHEHHLLLIERRGNTILHRIASG